MRRLAGILLVAIVAAVTPLTADLTITTVTTIEGAMMSAAPGGLTPKVVVRISGTKSRMDVDTGDQVVITMGIPIGSGESTNLLKIHRVTP